MICSTILLLFLPFFTFPAAVTVPLASPCFLSFSMLTAVFSSSSLSPPLPPSFYSLINLFPVLPAFPRFLLFHYTSPNSFRFPPLSTPFHNFFLPPSLSTPFPQFLPSTHTFLLFHNSFLQPSLSSLSSSHFL